MKQDIQLKLQAYLDGELLPSEAKAVADLVAQDAQARELLTELTNTRAVIGAHEADIKVPATREFYWSGIRREIERLEDPPPQTQGVSIYALLRRMLIPASGLAVVVLAVMLAGNPIRSTGNVVIEETETTFADAGAFTYRDYDSGTTLVWVDYPAENEFAEMDLDDILDFN
jgi:anti-sigma factor RsiW